MKQCNYLDKTLDPDPTLYATCASTDDNPVYPHMESDTVTKMCSYIHEHKQIPVDIQPPKVTQNVKLIQIETHCRSCINARSALTSWKR